MKKKVFSKLLMVALVATVGIFSSCKDYDDDISDVNGRITQTATELRTDYTNKINVVNTAVEKLQTQYDQLTDAYKKADEALKATLETSISDNLAVAKAYTDAAKGEALSAATAAEQAAKAYADIQRAEAEKAALAAAKEQVAAAKQELTEALAKANEILATQGQSIEKLIEADKTLDAAIKTAQARADEAYALADKANTLAEQNKANLEKAAADIATLQTELANLKGSAADKADVAKLQSDLKALQTQVNENVVNLADYKENITKLTSDLATLKEDLAKQVSILGESIAAVKLTADANVAKIEAINTQLAELKEANTQAHEQIIASVNSLAQTVENNKNAAADALKAAVEGIEAKLGAVNTLIESNDAAIRALVDTKASELKALIDGNTAAIAKNAQTIEKNAEAQAAENVLMNNAIAKNAQDIVAQGKDITSLEKAVDALKAALGDDTAATLKEYAASIAKSEALQAKLDAQGYADAQDAAQKVTIMDAIAQQAQQDKDAWTSAINLAIDNLIKTYELVSLKETLQAYADHAASTAQSAAETNAAAKAQEISDNALKAAKAYTDVLAQTLKDNYTETTDMQAQIAAAQNAAIAQAYKEVLNKLLDGTDWASLIEQDKDYLTGVVPPSILTLIKNYVDEIGLSPEKIQNQIDDTIEDYITAAMTPSAPAEMGKPAVEAGVIMVAIEAAAKTAAENLAEVNNALDARIAPIEAFLGETLGEGEAFKASVNNLIIAAKLAKASDLEALKNQVDGYKIPDMQTALAAVEAQAATNASDVQKIQTTINNINAMFTGLFGASEATSNVDDAALQAFEANIQALVDRIKAMGEVVDNLDDKVMESINKNLGPQIQTMITDIHLFANQHMAERDEQFKLAQWDGQKWIYPYGYDNFDHTLTFMYTIESGIYSSYCPDAEGNLTLAEEKWNYPAGLIKQLKTISSTRDQQYPYDYDFSYDEGGFTGDAADFDFVDGRYRSYEDSILVRVSPTNADLAKAEIALLNSKGEDIIDAGLIQLVDVKRYTRDSYIVRDQESIGRYYYGQQGWSRETRAAEGNETGLWVIKFKLNDAQVGKLWDKYAYATTTKDNKEQLTGNILYAVAVKNTNFSTESTEDVDRYVVSEYDLDLGTAEPEHAWDFTVNDISISDIHNRYIMPEEAPNGETSWTDDPIDYTTTFRYELTWHNLNCDAPAVDPDEPGTVAPIDDTHPAYYTYCWKCWCLPGGTIDDDCEDEDYGYKHPAWSSILFNGDMDNYTSTEQKGVNTCDRHDHTIGTDGKRQMDGIDNRHQKDFLPIEFNYTMPGEDDGYKWAKIDIEFPITNNCGVPTPIRGFFVTLDNHFAIESQNSEVNAWAQYIFKNVAAYNYDHHQKKTKSADATDVIIDRKIVLQPGNKGTIYIKDAANILNDEIVGFRVHAVNLDGTLVDPDGRAFYVKIGKKTLNHELSFNITADTLEAYAVQNADAAGNNPIAAYNNLMYSEGSSDRFFNAPAYNSSYVDSRNYKVVYTWRADNPAIRVATPNGTQGYIPVEGTGKSDEKNAYGTFKTVLTPLDDLDEVTTNKEGFDVEDLFNFWYSENPAADIKNNDDNKWKEFSTEDGETPNVKTMSMRAGIKEKVANRLIDGATYKIKMTILREDAQTVWSVVNTYDIDITKDMPTGMPEKFSVKSNQLKEGKWTVYLRPYGATDGSGNAVARDAWKVTWAEYAYKWLADVDRTQKADDLTKALKGAFATNFNGDIDLNGDEPAVVDPTFHNQRWGVDARPYNFDEMFNGLHTEDDEDNKVFDENYFFLFKGAGSYAGAEEDIKNDTPAATADADNAGKDAIAVYNKNYTGEINPEALDHSTAPAYSMPKIHWSKVDATVNVEAGYIYRNISATLNGDEFYAPQNEKSGKYGLSITNDDYEIAPVAVKLGDKMNGAQVKVTYKCAFSNAITFTADNANNDGFAYNEDVVVNAKAAAAKFKLAGNKWAEDAGDERAFFDAQLPIKGKTATMTLASMLETPWLWLDVKSLKVNVSSPSGYDYLDYNKEPYFTVGEAKFDPAVHKFNQITGITMERFGTSAGDPDFHDAVTGTFTFKVYDVWFHETTVTVKWKKKAPTNQQARQAK